MQRVIGYMFVYNMAMYFFSKSKMRQHELMFTRQSDKYPLVHKHPVVYFSDFVSV